MRRFIWVGAVAGFVLSLQAWGSAWGQGLRADPLNRPDPTAQAPVGGGLTAENAAPPPASDAAWQEFRGKVVISDVLLASQFGSDQVKIHSLNRVQRASVSGAEGFWRLHFIAFLDAPVGGDSVNLIAYEAGDKTRRPVKVFEVPVQPGSRELHLNNFVVSESMGFQRGQAYELVIEAPGKSTANGKQDVAARGMITLR